MNRTYRDRKDKYTKSLEAEVQRAALRETKLVREVERLTDLLSLYRIPPTSQSPGDTGEALRATAESPSEAATPKVHPARPRKRRGPEAVVSPGGESGHEISNITSQPALLDSTRTRAYPEDPMEVLMSQPLSLGVSDTAVAVRLENPDLVALAMEFVLTYVRFLRARQ